jgi:hypothetical protein
LDGEETDIVKEIKYLGVVLKSTGKYDKGKKQAVTREKTSFE